MRIIYFRKYIAKEVLNDHILEDCPLVIDGHQFFYSIYEKNKLPYQFGSEANEYARCLLRKPLNMLKKAKIKCYFVFKGGDTDIEKKISRLETVNYDCGADNYVPPIFLREVCLQALEEIGLDYSTCVMETVDDCVALAQLLGCPILSTGAAYYFRRVPFIPTESLKYSNPNNYIHCKQYELSDFLSMHSITERKAAMFAALTDIHLFPANYFDDLLKSWLVSDVTPHIQISKLLKYLSDHTEDEVIINITEYFSNEDDSIKFLRYVDKILDKMQNNHETFLTEYLYSHVRRPMSHPDPLWFEKGVAAQNIAIPYINLYKHKFILGSCAIENKAPIDSIMLSIDIIKYAYNLLTNYQTTDIFVYQDAENYIKVNTGDTIANRPIYECYESVFENGWKFIKRLKLFEHFLIENNVNIDKVDVPDDMRMLFIALTYFARKKLSDGVDVTKQVYCFILCCVMLYHRTVSYHKCEFMLCQAHGINVDDFNDAARIMAKYFVCYPDDTKDIDTADLKTLVELQHCLLHINYLNELCGAPYLPTKYRATFNGTFIYKLLRDMPNCHSYQLIQDLLKTTPSMLNFINKLINAYHALIDV